MNFRRFLFALAVLMLPALPARAITIEKVTSDKGIEAWLVQDHSNPIVVASFAFRGGSATDPQGKAGLATMAASLLDEGAGDMNSQAFQGKLEDLAISLGFAASDDAVRGQVKTMTENRDTAFDMLRLALTQPRFDADAVERIRGQLLAQLSREQQDPDTIADHALMKALYPSHPYGVPANGDADSIKGIAVDDLKGWVASRLGRDQLYISVVGDITPDQLKGLLDKTFGDLPEKAQPVAVADVAADATGKVEVIRRPIPQSVVAFGEQGLKRDDPDWYTAFVMNYILGGGGFSSRLMTEVRVKRGLAYGIYSYLVPRDHSGAIEGGVGTRNDKVAETLKILREQWGKMAEGGVTPQELADAKRYLNGSFPLQMDSTSSIASLLITVQMDHLGLDYLDRRASLINAVSVDDVKRVAKRLLLPDHLTAVVVGDPQGL